MHNQNNITLKSMKYAWFNLTSVYRVRILLMVNNVSCCFCRPTVSMSRYLTPRGQPLPSSVGSRPSPGSWGWTTRLPTITVPPPSGQRWTPFFGCPNKKVWEDFYDFYALSMFWVVNLSKVKATIFLSVLLRTERLPNFWKVLKFQYNFGISNVLGWDKS